MAKKTDEKVVKTENKKGISKIIACGCTSTSDGNSLGAKFQNEKYGENMRLHLARTSKNEFSCSICGRVKSA